MIQYYQFSLICCMTVYVTYELYDLLVVSSSQGKLQSYYDLRFARLIGLCLLYIVFLVVSVSS